MGGAVSAGHDHDDLIDKLKSANYVKTPSVENVYRAVDRAFYFLPECQDTAYKDLAWKKGNIHLSAPCIYAEVLESLLLEPGLSFLNLGSGTGYLSTMVGLVLGPYGVNHGVELYEDVVEYANSRLNEFKKTAPALDCYEFCEPHFVKGNSLLLGTEIRQYDRVYCGAACPENHENYMKNLLKVGGVLVMPLNDKLMQITRKSEFGWESKSVLSVSFSTLQLPQPNDSSPDKIITLPEINPLSLQEICRSVIRSLLRKEAKEEHADIAIRRRKYYRNKRRRMLPNLIIPILESSDDEGDFGRNNIFVPAGLRNIGCVVGIASTIGGRGYRVATHAIAPRLREGDDGFAVEDAADIEHEPANGTGEAGASSSRSARASTHRVNQDNDDAIEEEDDDDDDDELPDFGGLHNIFNFLRQPALKPWWQGPNVCVQRDVKEEEAPDSKTESAGNGFLVFGVGISQFSSCKHSPSRYVCTTVTTKDGKTNKSTVTYQCCHGSRRVQGKDGCQIVDTKSVIETAKEIGCNQFEQAVENEGLVDSMSGNKTVFMPVNDAFLHFKMDEPSGNSIQTNEVMFEEDKAPSKKDVLLNHIVPGVYEMSDLENEMLLTSENNKTLRINGYPGGVVTINCALVNATDKLTSDGVIHTVDKVLVPVTHSLADLLEEKRFSKFKKLLEENGLFEPLKGEKTATVFALTNDQVDLLEPKHAMCMQTILRHHILPHTVCSAAVRSSRISSTDLAENWVHMERTEDGTVVLDKNVKVTESDKMATNGVLHVVDGFMVPSSARSATDLLQQTNHTRFLALLEKANLKKEVDKSPEITLFVPVDSRLDDLEKLEGDDLKNTLLFHIADGKFDSDYLDNGVMLKTKDHDEKIRVTAKANVLSALMGQDSSLSVQCVPLTRVDGRICNGYAHEVSKPLTPASSTVLEVIEKDSRFTFLKDALKGTKLEEQLKSGDAGTITLLAPSNESFKNLNADTLERIATDKEAADSFLRAHVLNDALCCSNVGPSSWPFVSTVRALSGAAIPTNRRSSDVTFGGVHVDTCDLIARDGIIHIIDGVLVSNKRRGSNPFSDEEIVIRKPNSDIILAGL
uniref:FAS1 domain-containing protein n=1 Tax=Lygus hesperus TaxID=30085 RepID=A0A0K8S8V3_LYGHE